LHASLFAPFLQAPSGTSRPNLNQIVDGSQWGLEIFNRSSYVPSIENLAEQLVTVSPRFRG
jgi:hypothetical protein